MPNVVQKAARLRQVSRLYLAGRSASEIAEKLGCKESTAREYCDELLGRWMTNSESDFRQRLAMDLARIQHIENEALGAWERSKRPAQTVTRTLERVVAAGGTGPDDDLFQEPVDAAMVCSQEVHSERGQCGDPRFLSLAKECVQERLRLMGAYKDSNIYAGLITPDQMMFFARTVVRGIEEECGDQGLVERLKSRTLDLLPGCSRVDREVSPTVQDVQPDEPEHLNGTTEDV